MARPLGINWIGLYTMVRREVSRMMRVPIQAFIAPWISALLFIFIFGFVVGGRISPASAATAIWNSCCPAC